MLGLHPSSNTSVLNLNNAPAISKLLVPDLLSLSYFKSQASIPHSNSVASQPLIQVILEPSDTSLLFPHVQNSSPNALNIALLDQTSPHPAVSASSPLNDNEHVPLTSNSLSSSQPSKGLHIFKPLHHPTLQILTPT